MAGLRARVLIIDEWQRWVLAQRGIDVEAVERMLGALSTRADEHCDCSAIPWPDHWHRRTL